MTPDFYTRKEKRVFGGDSMSQRIGGSWVEQGRWSRELEREGVTFTFDAGPSLSIASGQALKMRARAGPAHPRSRLQVLESFASNIRSTLVSADFERALDMPYLHCELRNLAPVM